MFCQLLCPNLRCRKILRVPDETRGRLVRCQNCHTLLRVPAARAGTIPHATVHAAGASRLAQRHVA